MNLRKLLFIFLLINVLPTLMIYVFPDISLRNYINNIYAEYEKPGKDDKNPDAALLAYPVALNGAEARGARLFELYGCAHCHTQMVRPDYAGSDRYRDTWGGRLEGWDEGGGEEMTRETRPEDYIGESIALLGTFRFGPDLANFGYRYKSEADIYRKILDTRAFGSSRNKHSNMPTHKFLFKRVDQLGGKTDKLGIVLDDEFYFPNSDARDIAGYLMSLRKDLAPPSK